MLSLEIDYKIFGDDMQVVEVEFDPAEVVIAEAGAMNWIDNGIDFEAMVPYTCRVFHFPGWQIES